MPTAQPLARRIPLIGASPSVYFIVSASLRASTRIDADETIVIHRRKSKNVSRVCKVVLTVSSSEQPVTSPHSTIIAQFLGLFCGNVRRFLHLGKISVL